MVCLPTKKVSIGPGVFDGNGPSITFTASESGEYGVTVYLATSVIHFAYFYVTILVNGKQVTKQQLPPNEIAPIKIGEVSANSTITVQLNIYGAIITANFQATLGYTPDYEICAYASDFPNIPILNNVKGAVCINPQQGYISVYNGCNEVTGIPCLDCVASKRIPLHGTLQPGENIITFKASGPLSSNVISALQQALPPGKTVEGVYVKSVSVSGSTLTMTVVVPQTQCGCSREMQTAQFWFIVAIAVLVVAVALAITFLYVTVKQTGVVAAGFSVGLALLLGGAGLGIGYAVYQKMKGK